MNVQAYYSIMQYCPNPGRDERLNVGLILVRYGLDEKTLQFWGRTIGDAAEVAGILGGDPEIVADMARSNMDAIKVITIEGQGCHVLDKFLASRCNQIRFTQRRSVSCGEHNFDLDGQRMFDELVTRRSPA